MSLAIILGVVSLAAVNANAQQTTTTGNQTLTHMIFQSPHTLVLKGDLQIPQDLKGIWTEVDTAKTLHLKNLVADGELRPDQTNYVKAGPIEERKWYKVAEANVKELPFYTKQGLVPSVRKMYYRHVELGNLEKCKSDYDRLCRVAAEQRKGIDSTYTKSTIYPRLSIDCFRDEKRILLGNTNIDNNPSDPTPDEAPQDWEEYIEEEITAVKNHFHRLKNAPDNYDGGCSPGDKGVNPRRGYNQPTYREIWCESATIQPETSPAKDKLTPTQRQFVENIKALDKLSITF